MKIFLKQMKNNKRPHNICIYIIIKTILYINGVRKKKKNLTDSKIIWHDRKRWTATIFTRYYLVENEGDWLKLFTLLVGYLLFNLC